MKNNSKLNLTHTSKTFNENQFNLYKKRLNSVNLIWVNQVLDIIENKLKKFNFKSFFILDKSTNNSSKFKLINNAHKRYMYIVLGVKNKLSNSQ